MRGQVRRALWGVVAIGAVFLLGFGGLIVAAAIAGGLLVDALWTDTVDDLRKARKAAELRAEAMDREADEYYRRMREAEGRALAVDLAERMS